MSLSYEGKRGIEAWQSLVHVCPRWRSLVLGSPRRLNLQLYCTPGTSARDKLDIWPALPLIVGDRSSLGMDGVIPALEQSNRVRQIDLYPASWQLEEVLATMQVPFPELTHLQLISDGETALVVPDSFLGGSAPRLRIVNLKGIPFPGLPNLLLSANHLVHLWLYRIPRSGYIPPEAIVALFFVLSSLETFSLGFRFPQSPPGRESRSLSPPKCTTLPALNEFRFVGVSEYLEELVAHIDTPQLVGMNLFFFDQINFDCSQLAHFINRTPTLGACDEAHLQFGNWNTNVTLLAPSSTLEMGFTWREPLDRQLSSVTQVCNSSLHPLSTVEDLYIERQNWGEVQKIDAIDNTLWLELLLPFTAVKNLYLSKEFAPGIAVVLQELVGGRITEVSPNLQNVFVEGPEPSGPVQESIGQFMAARWHTGHPIAISGWDKDSDIKQTKK